MTTDPARFDRVLEHPSYSATANHRIELPHGPIAAIAGPSALAMFGVLFLLVTIGAFVGGEAPLWFMIPFVAGAFVFIVGGARIAMREARFHRMPIERLVAVVAKERTEISGDGKSASTTYYTTLQTRDGHRVEYETPESLVGQLVIDDIGVAYVKAHMLVGFTRFDA